MGISAFKAGLACLAIMLATGAPIMAQTAIPSATPQVAQAQPQVAIGLEEIRARTLANSAAVKKAGITVDTALLVEKGQSYSVYPSISAQTGAGFSYGESVAGSFSLGLTVSEKIYDGGKSAILAAVAALATETARATARAAILSALQTADQAYFAVLEADASVEAASIDLEAGRTALGLAQGRFAAGIATKSEVLKAESDLAAKETSLAQARSTRKTAAARLASLTGLAPATVLQTVDFDGNEDLTRKIADLDEKSAESFIARLLAAATKNSPSLQADRLAREKASFQVRTAKAAYLPSVSASLSNSLALRTTGANASPFSGSLSLSASIPLDLWNTANEIDKATKSASSSAIDLEEDARSAELDLRTAVYSWIAQAGAIYSTRKASEYADANYDNALDLYKLQAAIQSDLSSAQVLASAARRLLVQSRYAFLRSITTLRTLAGVDSDKLLVDMVP